MADESELQSDDADPGQDPQLAAKLAALKLAGSRGTTRRAAKRALHAGGSRLRKNSDDEFEGIAVTGLSGAASAAAAGDGARVNLVIHRKKKARRFRKRKSDRRSGDVESHDFAEGAGSDLDSAELEPDGDNNDANEEPSPNGSYLELPTTAMSRPGSTTTELTDSDIEDASARPANADATTLLAVKSDMLAPPSRPSRSSSRSSSSSSSSHFLTPGEVNLQSPPLSHVNEKYPFSAPSTTHDSAAGATGRSEVPEDPLRRSETLRSINVDGPAFEVGRKGKKPSRASSFRLPPSVPFIGNEEVKAEGWGRPRPTPKASSSQVFRRSKTDLDDVDEVGKHLDEGGSSEALPFPLESAEMPVEKSRSRAGSSLFGEERGVGSFVRRTATMTKRKLDPRARVAGDEATPEHQHRLHRPKKKRRKPKTDTDHLKEAAELIVGSMHAAGYDQEELRLKEERATDVLFENQRGLFFLGSRYGSSALLPGDPHRWTKWDSEKQEYIDSPFDIFTHTLPTPAWRWLHQEWLVNMAGDVDSEGFAYSTRFGSKYWRGVPSFRFYVRRRMWIRTRYRPAVDPHTLAKLAKPSHHSNEIQSKCNPDISAGPKDHMSPLTPEQSVGGAPSAAPDGSEELPREADRSSSAGREALQDLLRHNPVTISNPFVSWYAALSEKGKAREPVFHKEDLVHANFGRVARALSKTTQLDRERLAWFEYWLGERQDKPELVVARHADSGEDDSGKEDDDNQRRKSIDGTRPDVRDVWDLIEDRLDALLQLFDYQDSRREFLTLLARIHDSSHAGHKYPNKSASSQAYGELSPIHEHGGSSEMGGSPAKSEKQNREDLHRPLPRRAVGQDRLHFAADIRRRLRDLGGDVQD